MKGPKKFRINLGHIMFFVVILCSVLMVFANFRDVLQKEKVRVVCESGSFLDGVSEQYPWLDIVAVDSVGKAHIAQIADNSSSETSSEPPVSEKININTASSEELQTLNGIGETKAAAIIQYRTENGGFNSIEEICRVKGIGDATFNKIRDKITI